MNRLSTSLRAWASTAVVAAMLCGTHANAATIDVSFHRVDDIVVIEASALVSADAQTAWRVLTDYEHYVDFVPGLTDSRVVSRHGDRLTVTQSGDASFWLLHMPYDVTYDVTEFPPFRVESRASASALRHFESTYVLTPLASSVRIEYFGRLAPRSAWMGRIEQMAARLGIVREFEALVEEIERVATKDEADRARATARAPN